MTQHRLYVRSTVPKQLKRLATFNYGVFLHLAACHERLETAKTGTDETSAEQFARTGVYTFYSRLYSAGELVRMFLAAVKATVYKYNRTTLKSDDARLGSHASGNLVQRYRLAFKKARDSNYRDPAGSQLGLSRHRSADAKT